MRQKKKRPILGFSDILVDSLFGSWTDEEEQKKRRKRQQEELMVSRAVHKKRKEEKARREAEKKQKWHNKYGVNRKKDDKQ